MATGSGNNSKGSGHGSRGTKGSKGAHSLGAAAFVSHMNPALQDDEDLMSRLRRNFRSWAVKRGSNPKPFMSYDKSPKPARRIP